MRVIQFKNVWEMYRIKFVIKKQAVWENLWALKDINFAIEKGESVGIIGENGSGKSTILKLIAGMLKSDRGEVEVLGRVSGLLELGAGFHPELTGRENLYLNASMFGINEHEIDVKFEQIVEFAGIGRFIDAPIKCYSQGMFVRLAFAIAIHVEPEVLLIDDTLAVGDEDSQRKCVRKIFELKEQGKTIIFVTHDMNMVSHLCERTIFLKEGRIVEDGETKKIVNRYMETVGEKKGIAVVRKGPLRATFNNGKILLSWNGISLTKGLGGHACLLLFDRNYGSIRADWQVKRLSEHALLAEGKWRGLPITQKWYLHLEDSGSFFWQIEMDVEREGLQIKQVQVNLMLTNQYAHWLKPGAEGEFYPILPGDVSWEEIAPSSLKAHCLGVQECYLQRDRLPMVIFEAEEEKSSPLSAKIFNSDYFTSARLLQFVSSTPKIGSKGKSFCFSGRILFDLPDVGAYLVEKTQRVGLNSGPLKLAFEDGRMRLFWDRIELTKSLGIYSTVVLSFATKSWQDSTQADWQVEEASEYKLIVSGKWRRLPITQKWEIVLEDKTSIRWKAEMEVHQKVNIEALQAHIVLSNKYEQWVTSDRQGRGKFPATFYNDWTDILQGAVTRGFVAAKSKERESLPTIMLNIGDEDLNHFAKIFNTGFQFKARVLQLCKVQSEDDMTILPGKYPCFQAKLHIDYQKAHRDKSPLLQQGPLKLLFDQGRGQLFWQEVELTKRLSLYSSIRCAGRWHDSTQADWKVEKATGANLALKGRWRHLPVCQFWRFRLLDKNIIEWKIVMEILEKINLDREQTNLMLLERYKEWVVCGKVKGRFPEFKQDVDDDWHRIWSGGLEDEIGVLGVAGNEKSLPSITFSGFSQGEIVNIVNSDVFYRGRILQCLRQNRGGLIPGKYDYFSGRITLDNVR